MHAVPVFLKIANNDPDPDTRHYALKMVSDPVRLARRAEIQKQDGGTNTIKNIQP